MTVSHIHIPFKQPPPIPPNPNHAQQGDAHRTFRNGLAPAFTYDAINSDFLPVIAAVVDKTLKNAAAATAEGREVGGYDMFKKMTFEIILNVSEI